MTSKSQRIRAQITSDIFGMTPASIGYTIRQARKAMGLTPEYIAECMCVSTDDWLKYEQNNKLVPSNVVMKLIMFGMDFWCKNRESFVPACAGMTEVNQKLSELCTLNSAH